MADNSADDDLKNGTDDRQDLGPSWSPSPSDQVRRLAPRSAPIIAESGRDRGTTSNDRIVVLAIGDVHGLYEPVIAATREVPEASAILQVGDLTAGKPGRETHVDGNPSVIDALPIPFIWVHGNHEHWDLFTEAGAHPSRLPGIHLWPGSHVFVPGTGIGVVGLPGNYAPSWYDEPKPFPGDRCRHFNRHDVEAMSRHPFPNVLLMHEAFRGQAPGRIGVMGIPVLARLVAELRPAVVLTGHHHLLGVAQHGPTLAIALPPAWDGYARLEFRRSGALTAWEFRAFEAVGTHRSQLVCDSREAHTVASGLRHQRPDSRHPGHRASRTVSAHTREGSDVFSADPRGR